MNRNLIGTLSLAVLSLTLTTGALAQSVVKADVPFTFNAGAAQMPAGQYVITENHLQQMINIRNIKTGALVTVPVQMNSYAVAYPALIFRTVGDRHFLAQISAGKDGSHLTIAPSKLEKQLYAVEVARGQSNTGKEVLMALK